MSPMEHFGRWRALGKGAIRLPPTSQVFHVEQNRILKASCSWLHRHMPDAARLFHVKQLASKTILC